MDASTGFAVELFEKIEKMKTRLHKMELQLNGYVLQLPESEMDKYIELTQTILDQEEEKR